MRKPSSKRTSSQNILIKKRTSTSLSATVISYKKEFLKKLSYELRTPLSSIIGFCQLLYSEKIGPLNHEQKEYLADINLSAQHLLSFVANSIKQAPPTIKKIKRRSLRGK